MYVVFSHNNAQTGDDNRRCYLILLKLSTTYCNLARSFGFRYCKYNKKTANSIELNTSNLQMKYMPYKPFDNFNFRYFFIVKKKKQMLLTGNSGIIKASLT